MILLLAVWTVLIGLWSIFTYSLTDHNLTLTALSGYWSVQNWLWEVFFSNRLLLVTTYCLLIVSWFAVYFLLLRKIWNSAISIRWVVGLLAVSSGILLFSYNALSHDVFNYLFNARMVLEYGANPHHSVALDFPSDLWTRFMHNTHTPAPYGYGWTAISLLPSWLGSDRFTLSWLLFRAFGITSLFLLADITSRLLVLRRVPQKTFWLAVVVLNPLVLIEVISSSHNDLWMMVPALWAFYLLEKYSSKKMAMVSLVLLLFSITAKLATILLLPLWAVLALRNFVNINRKLEESVARLLAFVLEKVLRKMQSSKSGGNFIYGSAEMRNTDILRKLVSSQGRKISDALTSWWPTLSALGLFATFLTDRSTYFHPWYLLWVFVFIPFIQKKQLQTLLLFFSFSSLLRYVPWLYTDEYTADVLQWRVAITWGVPILLWMLYQGFEKRKVWHNLTTSKNHA